MLIISEINGSVTCLHIFFCLEMFMDVVVKFIHNFFQGF
jgi:hypothetical protein